MAEADKIIVVKATPLVHQVQTPVVQTATAHTMFSTSTSGTVSASVPGAYSPPEKYCGPLTWMVGLLLGCFFIGPFAFLFFLCPLDDAPVQQQVMYGSPEEETELGAPDDKTLEV